MSLFLIDSPALQRCSMMGLADRLGSGVFRAERTCSFAPMGAWWELSATPDSNFNKRGPHKAEKSDAKEKHHTKQAA
ncbi:hypothetical protein PQR34_46590 [Paraburkholderia sediminicola]|uniref:hypothetical protein n=1 Tax=Paraburkholderia sediminicola TaxID=458836 RepID=UPI0038B93099